MSPEPFQSFDAGWVLLGVAVFAIVIWLLIDIRRSGAVVHDDDDYDVEPRRNDPESDARQRPF